VFKKDKFPIPGKGYRPKGSEVDWQTKYHTYGIEWNEEKIDYYVDNVLYFTRNATGDHLTFYHKLCGMAVVKVRV